MARIEVTMPKMGESIMEGTVVEWIKKVGDTVQQDEALLEIGTDKVDSEVPAPDSGTLVEILVDEGETVEVGEAIAIIETDPDAAKKAMEEGSASETASQDESGEEQAGESTEDGQKVKDRAPDKSGPESEAEEEAAGEKAEDREEMQAEAAENADQEAEAGEDTGDTDDTRKDSSSTGADNGKASGKEVADMRTPPQRKGSDGRFFSPLVRAIATEEGLSQEELESIEGSGSQGRVTKQDVLDYVKSGGTSAGKKRAADTSSQTAGTAGKKDSGLRKPGDQKQEQSAIQAGEISPQRPQENVEIIKMDRMRKVISEHMIRSKQTAAHVTTFGEADVTRLVRFREKNRDKFYKENGFKLTFTPFFVEATIQALREYPLLNSSVDGDRILLKRDINYGIAVALGEAGTGGLVVPVIKNAGEKNVQGLARATHELARKARNKQLSPDDLTGGTFTLTNYGSVGNLMGTPIINQPQVAIFGTGIIQKRPVVMEMEGTDTIAIRHMVYLSMSYDHRIIDGAMGGAFVQKVKTILENFDENRSI